MIRAKTAAMVVASFLFGLLIGAISILASPDRPTEVCPQSNGQNTVVNNGAMNQENK